MGSAPRVRFLRKALTPTSDEGMRKLCSTTEILIATPLKLQAVTDRF